MNRTPSRKKSLQRGYWELVQIKVGVFASVASLVALLCVAAWTVWVTYYVKQDSQMSALLLKEMQIKTELSAHVGATLATHLMPAEGGASVLEIGVTLSNSGNDIARLNLDRRVLSVVKVERFEAGLPVYGRAWDIAGARYDGMSSTLLVFPYLDVGPSESYELKYVVKLDEPGLYLVRFLSRMKSDHIERHKLKMNTPSIIEYSTGADAFITVPAGA
ncbi:hypothetical protein GIW50_18530 [Pseudomonas syringae]|uniref:Uncharacterized protein n=1 Tax=Pseudomonas syringae TaxID=317 RepID=A0A9Q3X5A2_PSESX|nr:hypothetical protein [Pseudomonas syringae]MCF5063404.1 hypothetical protein [Pseudomonas syringae]MCF5075263.1 hypothetical protein [Pseudomonas syringae]MCF5120385.1 hypothetical protein [Pseudomonas syringae]